MNKRKRMIAGAVLSAGVALAGVGLTEGTAQALPGGPVPLSAWPGCPEENPSGPCHWCPGDPPVPQAGGRRQLFELLERDDRSTVELLRVG